MTKASHQSIPALSSIGIDIGKDVVEAQMRQQSVVVAGRA